MIVTSFCKRVPNAQSLRITPRSTASASHIFTYGHRNPQGLEVGPNGDLSVAEHGPSSDDEVSRLQAGGNFGWPYVNGYQDGQAYQYVNWSAPENCEELEYDDLPPHPPQVPVMNESEFEAENFVEPVVTFYAVGNDYNFTDHDCGALAFICNPTVALSSLRLYTSDVIPGWNGTFLMTTLKAGRIFTSCAE